MAYSWEEEEYKGYRPQYGGYQPPEAPSLNMASAAPAAQSGSLIPGLGLGLGVLGTGLNAYGAYKQGEQMEDQAELQEDAYNFDKALSLQDRAREEEERRRRAGLEGGGYASNYLDRAVSNYGRYGAMR